MALKIESPQRFGDLNQAWRWCFQTAERLNLAMEEQAQRQDEQIKGLQSRLKQQDEQLQAALGKILALEQTNNG